jgi:hypothetical protein
MPSERQPREDPQLPAPAFVASPAYEEVSGNAFVREAPQLPAPEDDASPTYEEIAGNTFVANTAEVTGMDWLRSYLPIPPRPAIYVVRPKLIMSI